MHSLFNDDDHLNLTVVLDYLLFITVELSLRTHVEHGFPLWGAGVVVSRDTGGERGHRGRASEGEGGGEEKQDPEKQDRHPSIRHASSHWLYGTPDNLGENLYLEPRSNSGGVAAMFFFATLLFLGLAANVTNGLGCREGRTRFSSKISQSHFYECK